MDHYLPTTLHKMTAVASIANAASVQFGWALQLSPLTPYIQLIGVPYKWAANISHSDARCPICVCQGPGKIIVSILSGQWDSLFGGSNLPSFVVGALAAVISGVLAVVVLPTPTP